MNSADNYRVVDYVHIDDDGEAHWMNTDPKGTITTDGSREGQGDPDPTTKDIEDSPWVSVGFMDADDEWHYYWIKGPFDEEYWLDDGIEQVVDKYGIVLGQ